MCCECSGHHSAAGLVLNVITSASGCSRPPPSWDRPTSTRRCQARAASRPDLPIEAIGIATGTGCLLALAGEIVTMPGPPQRPAAYRVDLSDEGDVIGL
jgi:hypothetical protein